jgi:GT2 family glycosyltransferase
MGGNPDSAVALSVVVPSVNGFADLERALTALTREAEAAAVEILVVDRCGDRVRARVRERFPGASLIIVPAETTIPAMRSVAFAAARGRSIAVIEDHVVVPPGWATAMLEAQRTSPVVGGAIENAATDTIIDWAAFFCEYSHCLPPLRPGPSDWLPGNNVVYRRDVLERYRDRLSSDQWENHLHALMRADGIDLICRPDIVVGHRKHYSMTEYLSQRYFYARSYAAGRVADAAFGRRIACGLASAALPPILLWRIVSRVLAKRRYRAELVRAVPLIAVFVCAWAAGEAIGSWFGAGDSLRKVC